MVHWAVDLSPNEQHQHQEEGTGMLILRGKLPQSEKRPRVLPFPRFSRDVLCDTVRFLDPGEVLHRGLNMTSRGLWRACARHPGVLAKFQPNWRRTPKISRQLPSLLHQERTLPPLWISIQLGDGKRNGGESEKVNALVRDEDPERFCCCFWRPVPLPPAGGSTPFPDSQQPFDALSQITVQIDHISSSVPFSTESFERLRWFFDATSALLSEHTVVVRGSALLPTVFTRFLPNRPQMLRFRAVELLVDGDSEPEHFPRGVFTRSTGALNGTPLLRIFNNSTRPEVLGAVFDSALAWLQKPLSIRFLDSNAGGRRLLLLSGCFCAQILREAVSTIVTRFKQRPQEFVAVFAKLPSGFMEPYRNGKRVRAQNEEGTELQLLITPWRCPRRKQRVLVIAGISANSFRVPSVSEAESPEGNNNFPFSGHIQPLISEMFGEEKAENGEKSVNKVLEFRLGA